MFTAASALFGDDSLIDQCDCCGSDESCCIQTNLSKLSERVVEPAKYADMYLEAAPIPPPAIQLCGCAAG